MARQKINDSEKLIHNLAVKFKGRELKRVHRFTKKLEKKPGTWARELILAAIPSDA